MLERLISSVVRWDYYVGEVNIICCKRGLLPHLTTDDINLSNIIVPSYNRRF
jgi:hypothetical protein